MIGEPPSLDGADHCTRAWPSPAVTLVIVGAVGVVNGVIVVVVEGVEPPVLFDAIIETVYVVPFVSPVIFLNNIVLSEITVVVVVPLAAR